MTNMYVPGTIKRLFALGIDSGITGLMFLPLLIDAWLGAKANGGLFFPWSWLLLTWFLQLAYSILFLYFTGATIGKWMLGLRVVPFHHPNAKLQLMQVVLRVFADQFGLVFGHAHRCLALFRLDRRHLSDWIAETRVVQFYPRATMPRRRWLLGLLLFLILGFEGVKDSYQFIQAVKIKKAGILLPAAVQFDVDFNYQTWETVMST